MGHGGSWIDTPSGKKKVALVAWKLIFLVQWTFNQGSPKNT
jgi:hypothetical protein